VEPAEPFRGMDLGDSRCSDECSRSSADLALALGLSLKGRISSTATCERSEILPEPVLEGERT